MIPQRAFFGMGALKPSRTFVNTGLQVVPKGLKKIRFRHGFCKLHLYLEPQTTIYHWLFQLDDSKSLYRKCLFHQTSILNWLFGVPGTGRLDWRVAGIVESHAGTGFAAEI